MTVENSENKNKRDWHLLKRLFPYLKKYRLLIFISILFMVLFNVASVLQPYLFKVGIDIYVARGDMKGLFNLSIWLFTVMAAGFLFNFLFNYAVQFLGQRLLFDIRMDLFGHMCRLAKKYFDKNPVGKTLTNITNDVEALRQFISEGVVLILGDLLKVGFILIAMMLINFKLAMVVFLTIPFFIVVTIVFRKSIRSGFRGIRKANAEINTAIVESVTGVREINQFNYQQKSIQLFDRVNSKYLSEYLKVVHAYALYFPILEIVTNLGLVIILLYFHYSIGKGIQIGEIFAFFTYINLFFRPLRQLAERFNMFQSAMAASERIFKLFDTRIHIKNVTRPVNIKTNHKGKIVFDNVNFSNNKNAPVLKDISFTIQPGETVALAGHTGCGKTTVINLINRLYDISSGSITIDGKDIKQYDLAELRKQVVVVPQDPFLFTGTVGENISLNDPEILLKDILSYAKKMGAHTFIEEFPNLYNENVLEEGKKLSAGQQQLISFTRAMARNPSILILDEATSNIDSETEKQIEAATHHLIKNRTAIIIAHRLSTIKMVNRILVLHKGKLVEEGNHKKLLNRGGIYANLYKIQAFSTISTQ